MARETAFHPITSQTAAGFGDEAGWLWVTNFGDPAAEYRAVREGVGMWDLSPAQQVGVPGPGGRRGRAARPHQRRVGMPSRARSATARFVDEDGHARRRRHGVQASPTTTCGCARTATTARSTSPTRPRGSTSRSPTSRPSCRACRSKGPRAASCCARSPTSTSTRCGTSGSSPSRCRSAACPCGSRAPGSAASSASSCSCGPSTRADLWEAVEGAGATPYGWM